MTDPTPKPLALADYLETAAKEVAQSDELVYARLTVEEARSVSSELRRQHQAIVELREALSDLELNVCEAMKTGGWVPTPLRQSFWQSMSDARATLTKHQET